MLLSKITILALSLFFLVQLSGQESDGKAKLLILNNEIKLQTSLLDSLKKQKIKLKESLLVLPYWKFSVGGILGMDFNHFSNWVGQGKYNNSSTSSISSSIKAEANLKGEQFYWRNRGKMTLAWNKLDIGDEEDSGFHKTVDIININTQLGSQLNDELAMSMLAEWKSNLLNQSLSPSYMDMSIGVTWTPVKEVVAVMHPVNYELVLSEKDQFDSSLGAKLVMEYDHNLTKNLQIKSNLSGFMSYKNIDELTNYTWTNGLNIKILNNIGLGVEYALRVSPQETAAIASDEDVQSYVVMGVSYVMP